MGTLSEGQDMGTLSEGQDMGTPSERVRTWEHRVRGSGHGNTE